jgi:hypothetical protein
MHGGPAICASRQPAPCDRPRPFKQDGTGRMRIPGFTIRRWTPSSAVAMATALVATVGLAFVPLAFGANVTERLTILFVYLILAVIWNALAGYAGLVSRGAISITPVGDSRRATRTCAEGWPFREN